MKKMESTMTFGLLFCTSLYFSTILFNDLYRIQTKFSRLQRKILWSHCMAVLLQTVFGSSLLFLSSFKDGIQEGSFQCHVDGFVTSTTTFVIINHLALLCFTSSTHTQQIHEGNTVKLMALCWAIPFFLTVLPYMGIGKYVTHGNNSFCCLNWSSENMFDRMYFYSMFVIAFIVPTLLIMCSRLSKKTGLKIEPTKGRQILKRDISFQIAVLFIALWVPFGGATVHSLFGYKTPGDAELLAVVFGLSSYVLLPLILCQQLSRLQGPSLVKYDGFDFRSVRVCLHFLLFL